MIFGIKYKIEASDLKVQLEELRKENKRLAQENFLHKEILEDQFAKASFSVDWERMNAFSIERNWYDGTHRTIIGYMLQEPAIHTEGEEQKVTYKDIVREWYLHCSAEQHEKLVAEFNEYRTKK